MKYSLQCTLLHLSILFNSIKIPILKDTWPINSKYIMPYTRKVLVVRELLVANYSLRLLIGELLVLVLELRLGLEHLYLLVNGLYSLRNGHKDLLWYRSTYYSSSRHQARFPPAQYLSRRDHGNQGSSLIHDRRSTLPENMPVGPGIPEDHPLVLIPTCSVANRIWGVPIPKLGVADLAIDPILYPA